MTKHVNLNIAAIVPAAGIGSRMQSNLPKQYLKINHKTVLEHTLDKLIQVPNINEISIALSPDDKFYEQLNINDTKISIVDGGCTRALSVLNALEKLKNTHHKIDWVLVHDAARPLVCPKDINKLIGMAVFNQKGGILASKVKDTIKRASNNKSTEHVLETVPRDDLWQAMTPQLFKFDELCSALKNALAQNVEITDEASAMEWAGYDVMLVPGRSDNFKITTPEDLQLASFYLSQTHNILE